MSVNWFGRWSEGGVHPIVEYLRNTKGRNELTAVITATYPARGAFVSTGAKATSNSGYVSAQTYSKELNIN